MFKILMLFFIMFLIIYLKEESGYYEYKMYTKAKLTEESIIKFEKDVNDGKDVSIEEYIVNDYVDYSNSITNLGTKIGNLINNFMNNGIKKTLNILSELFYK